MKKEVSISLSLPEEIVVLIEDLIHKSSTKSFEDTNLTTDGMFKDVLLLGEKILEDLDLDINISKSVKSSYIPKK